MKISARQDETRQWSLASRLSWWAILVSTLPVLAAITLGYFFLKKTVVRELHAQVTEELAEAEGELMRSEAPRRHFGELTKELAEHHPSVAMAWRLFDQQTMQLIGEFGEPRLLERSSLVPDSAHDVHDLGHGIFLGSIAGPGQTKIVLVLDGSQHIAELSRYQWTALGIAGLCVLLSLLAGRVLVRKITKLLDRVVASLQGPRSGASESLTLGGLPLEFRHMAEALHKQLSDIRRQSEEVRLFTMSLAHELRSPVQNLIGRAEVALMRSRSGHEYEQVLSGQLEELMQFGDAVDNLLSIATRCSETNGHHQETFDLREEANLRLKRERERGQRKGVAVSIEFRGNLQMAGDRESLLRALRNLVANAVDWSPEGKQVTMILDGTEPEILVTVDDGGPGVAVEIRDQVFEAFFQGPSAGVSRVGYGLGLAMTKKAVAAQGGSITIEDSPMGGARFRMTLARRCPVRHTSADLPATAG